MRRDAILGSWSGGRVTVPEFFGSLTTAGSSLQGACCSRTTRQDAHLEREPAPVAQWNRASDFGSEGRGFESLRARHFLSVKRPFPVPNGATAMTGCRLIRPRSTRPVSRLVEASDPTAGAILQSTPAHLFCCVEDLELRAILDLCRICADPQLVPAFLRSQAQTVGWSWVTQDEWPRSNAGSRRSAKRRARRGEETDISGHRGCDDQVMGPSDS
jgi:hypothetical protein